VYLLGKYRQALYGCIKSAPMIFVNSRKITITVSNNNLGY